MIAHRGIRILRGFVGDPAWITPGTPSVGMLDRAIRHDELAARARGQEIPARVASQPDARGIGGTTPGGRSVVPPPTSAGVASQTPASPAGGVFSRVVRIR